jgi:hypothetical protein
MAHIPTHNPNSGRGTPAGWSSAQAYGKAYGQQRQLAGRSRLGVTNAEYQASQRKKGSFPLQFPSGGGRGGAGFAEDDLARQLAYDKAIWERSTPDIDGVGYNVKWDRDKNMVTAGLDEENQAIYDAMYERQKRFGAEVDAFSGTGRQDAQQQRFDQKRALYAGSDAREEAIRKANQYATGASTTGMYEEDARVAGNLNQRNMQLEEQAFLESQGLIDSSINRQYGAVGLMADLGNIANRGIVTPTPNTAGNMGNVSLASTRWADNLAMENAKRAKGKSDFFGSLLGSLFG